MTPYLSDQVIQWAAVLFAHLLLASMFLGAFLFVVLLLCLALKCFQWAVGELFMVPVLIEALLEAKRQGRAPWARRFLKNTEPEEV